jgi:hypothetical protein
MANRKILGLDIDRLIRKAIVESLPNDESAAQKKKEKELEDFKTTKKSEVDEAATEESPPKVKAEDIVGLFNTMRSGKSLKDEKVRKDFQLYFNSLSGQERIALFSFSQAMADIIAGVNNKQDIKDQPQPDTYGVELSTKKVKMKKKKKKKSSSGDEKSDNAPIVVGEAADKSREINILRSHK